MKNLKSVFDLLLFPFVFLKRKGLLFSLLFVAGTALFASNTPVISISPTTYNVNESSGTVTVNLNINIDIAPDTSAINITYQTVDGTATVANNNYASSSGNFTFDANGSIAPKSISITVNSNTSITSDIAFTVTLSDNGTNASQSYTGSGSVSIITIINNDPPIANNKTYQVSINDTSLKGNIITNARPTADSDINGDTITVSSHSSPSNSITIHSDGNFTYTPTTSFCGIDSFDYNITDGRGGSDTAVISIDNIGNTLDIPVDDYFVTIIDQNITGNVLKNDGNTTYTVSFPLTSLYNGTVTDKGNGSFLYEPVTGFTGVDTFDYNVSDGTCSTATATVEIQVSDICGGKPIPLCTTTPTTISVPKHKASAWYFILPVDAIVDINITNTGGHKLLYDFNKTSCSALFHTGTTSGLANGHTVDIVQKYPAGVYHFGFAGAHHATAIDISICYDTNLSNSGSSNSFFANVGINNANPGKNRTWYANFPNITTKIVNKNFGLRATFLDETVYDGGTDGAPLPVSLSFVDDLGTVKVPGIIYLEIDDNKSFVEMKNDGINYLDSDGGSSGKIPFKPNVVNYAAKIRKYKIASLNFGAISGNNSSLNCQWSSLSSSMCGLPACFNNKSNPPKTISSIEEVFPPAFFPHVLICLNGDGGAGSAPCDQNAYYGNCKGNKKPITPEKYDNYMGCFQCLHDAGGDPIYSDDFAIRPKEFDVNISNGDILIAGKPTSLAFKAPDGRDGNISSLPLPTLPSDEYNETQNSTFYVDLNVSNNSNCYYKELTITPNVNFIDGNHTDNFTFNDIGDINMSIHETIGTEFAIVDADDTPEYNTTIGGISVDGRLIHKKDVNFKVIPDHFNIEANLTDHNDLSNFTYLHDINITNDRSMASVLIMDIKAMNFNDINTTRNYTDGCYAKDTNLTLDLNDTKIIYPSSDSALTHFLYFNPVSEEEGSDPLLPQQQAADGTYFRTISSVLIENNTSSFEVNGTANIEYKLNFDRNMSLVVNPFKIVLKDVNITDTDNVTGSATDTAIRAGTVFSDQDATYYYGRAKSSQDYYKNITLSSVQTPIGITVYCDLNIPGSVSAKNCSDYKLFILAPVVGARWFYSTNHNAAQGDGNVTIRIGAILIEPAGDLSTDQTINGISNPNGANIMINSGGMDDTVQVSRGSIQPLPFTVPLELVEEGDAGTPPYTNVWLIYNEFNNSVPTPFYKVRFIPGSSSVGWTGVGKTGHAIDLDPDTSKPGRLDW